MKKIAIYGKGGIGKSTTVSNVAAALASQGKSVMQIGCDPKADSTLGLTGGQRIRSVLSVLREQREGVTLDDITVRGSLGVICVESGGPKPGTGCAGRGIVSAFEKLEELHAHQVFKPDMIMYDVLGDVVCGGFSMPLRRGFADQVYIVTSGEMMSLYAMGNIVEAVRSYSGRGYAELGGVILNKKGIADEEEIARKATAEVGVPIVFTLERDPVVQQAEALATTVIEAFGDSAQADAYRALADLLLTSPVSQPDPGEEEPGWTSATGRRASVGVREVRKLARRSSR
ncbi:MAG: nitrogenase iron protein NifH [Propioniciclava sp.]|uniref:nucleotide-binding protein n=1 Tax=Propioniciclava sp. TaxID=2038686 RepID=UPI0039E42457